MKEKGIYIFIVAVALATTLSLLSKNADSSAKKEASECIIAPHQEAALTQQHREMVLVDQILPPETESVPESAITRTAEPKSLHRITRLRVKVRRWVSR